MIDSYNITDHSSFFCIELCRFACSAKKRDGCAGVVFVPSVVVKALSSKVMAILLHVIMSSFWEVVIVLVLRMFLPLLILCYFRSCGFCFITSSG